MAILINADRPSTLLADIKAAIDGKRIQTWAYDSSGDFTHTPEQWIYKAWLRPTVTAGEGLKFGILGNRTLKLSKEVYAVYHGRFIEMLLAHFDDRFTSAAATAALVPALDVAG